MILQQVFPCTDDNVVKMIPIHKDARKQIKMMYYARQSSSRLAALVGVYGDTGKLSRNTGYVICPLQHRPPPSFWIFL